LGRIATAHSVITRSSDDAMMSGKHPTPDFRAIARRADDMTDQVADPFSSRISLMGVEACTTSHERARRRGTIFAEALRLPPEERAQYLAQATSGDAELRRRVEALLGSYNAGDFLEHAAASQLRQTLDVAVPLTEKPAETIGRYKLREQIGEGGCGVVYVAEQTEPVRRRVALKIIKLGMDTKSVIARFEAERQALALMDHPNIAKVFDAGATETGRPYFVMELVRGMKITDYCDEKKLSTRERLDLFIQVCQAIQHAHQKGIIHRDIKPSNILVTVSTTAQRRGFDAPKLVSELWCSLHQHEMKCPDRQRSPGGVMT